MPKDKAQVEAEEAAVAMAVWLAVVDVSPECKAHGEALVRRLTYAVRGRTQAALELLLLTLR